MKASLPPPRRVAGWGPPGSALAALAVAASLAGCGQRQADGDAMPAARVNKEAIAVQHVNQLLQQQRGLRPEQADAAGRQILERLIEQELAAQRADELRLDRDPRVVQALAGARREILARAYAEKVAEDARPPNAEEVTRYYEDKPALFRQRRIYTIQEIAIEARPEQVPALRERLAQSKTIAEFVDHLREGGYRFAGNQAVRSAEQLPLANLDAFASMKDGQSTLVPTSTGAQVVLLAGSRSQPLTLEQARPVIEQFLLNERRRKLIEEDARKLRSDARVEYLGPFAASAPLMPARPGDGASAPMATASAPLAPVPAPSPAASARP